MAAKDIEELTYVDLANYFSGGETTIDRGKLDKLLKDETRVEVINWDAAFDHMLKDIIIQHFSRRDKIVAKLFEPSIGGPLVSLTNKARLAYALELIDKTVLDDLKQIHNIRNIFAHSIGASFTDTEVRKLVEKFSSVKGKDVTAKNSYGHYKSAVCKCLQDIVDQQSYRQTAGSKEKSYIRNRKYTGGTK